MVENVFDKVKSIVTDWLKSREELAKDVINIGVNYKIRDIQE